MDIKVSVNRVLPNTVFGNVCITYNKSVQNKGTWNRQQSDHPLIRTIHTIAGSMCLNHDFQEPGKQQTKVMLYLEYLCQQGYYLLFYMSQGIPYQPQLVKYKATKILSSYSSDNKDSSFLGYDAMMTHQY